MQDISRVKNLIGNYIAAKDSNRPELMPQSFSPEAVLTMSVASKAISFPPETHGLQAISQLLVSDFQQQQSEVFTYCLEDSLGISSNTADCLWWVIMRSREDGRMRFGWGRYHWQFNASGLADLFNIQITAMDIIDDIETIRRAYQWQRGLPYPWLSSQPLKQAKSFCSAFNELQQFINEHLN